MDGTNEAEAEAVKEPLVITVTVPESLLRMSKVLISQGSIKSISKLRKQI